MINKKYIFIALISLFLFVLLVLVYIRNSEVTKENVSQSANHTQEQNSSRKAYEECSWETYNSEDLGIKFLLQTCYAENLSYKPVIKENKLFLLKEEATIDNNIPIIEVYEKDPNQNIQEAIKEKFANTESCEVIKAKIAISSGYSERYSIVPTNNDANDCGPYSLSDAVMYFEYHPKETTEKYIYVRPGITVPLIDEQSIVLY